MGFGREIGSVMALEGNRKCGGIGGELQEVHRKYGGIGGRLQEGNRLGSRTKALEGSLIP